MILMEQELADFAVEFARKSGAIFAEARLEETESGGFVLRNGNPEVSAVETSEGIGVRLIAHGVPAFMSTNILTKQNIQSIISTEIKMARASSRMKKIPVAFSEEKPNSKNYEAKQKVNLSDIGAEEKIKFLNELDKGLLETKLDIPGRVLVLSTGFEKKYYTNSEGSRIFSKIPGIGFLSLIAVKRGAKSKQRYIQNRSTTGWEIMKKWKLEDLLPREAKILDMMMAKAKKPPRGVMDVIIGPEVTGIASHESAGHPYEADRILGSEAAQAGESFATPSLIGKRIASPEVSVVDDPTIKGSAGFYLFDDEGVKSRPRYLIKKGVVNEFLHNRETAAIMNTKSNAAARALGYSNEPLIRMANTFVLPGKHTTEELIEGVKKGVYVKSFMEWNIDDRRMNAKYVGSEAYLVENGEVKHPVSNPVIEIDTFTFWRSIDAVGKKPEFNSATCGKGEPMQGIPVWHGGPDMRLRKIWVGGRHG